MVLYAEGYSVTNFLVGMSSRPAFLAFIAQGMRDDWDGAVRTHYRYNSVEELEQAWLARLRSTRQQPQNTLLASGTGNGESGRVVVRQTVPPAQPFVDVARPVFRGQMPGNDADDGYAPRPSARPTFLPETPGQSGGWRQNPSGPATGVRLGAPQFDPAPQPAQLGQPVFGSSSPVGFSH